MITFYIRNNDSNPTHYFKQQSDIGKIRLTVWTDNLEHAMSFENSVEAIAFAQEHLVHADCKIHQHVDYSDMWYG